MIFFINGLQWTGYRKLSFTSVVDRTSGRVRVTRVVAAVDAGQIVNPDGVSNQIAGGIIQSTSWTLMESVRFDQKRVTTRSWADYPIIRFAEVPEVDVVLLDQPAERFLGVGEGSQGPTAAAIASAIAHATGKRLRALPFTPDRVKQALAETGTSASLDNAPATDQSPSTCLRLTLGGGVIPLDRVCRQRSDTRVRSALLAPTVVLSLPNGESTMYATTNDRASHDDSHHRPRQPSLCVGRRLKDQ